MNEYLALAGILCATMIGLCLGYYMAWWKFTMPDRELDRKIDRAIANMRSKSEATQ